MIAAFFLATAACTSPKKDAKNNAFSAAEEEAETIESEMPQEADSQDKQTTFTYGSHAYTMTGTLNAEAYDEKATGMVTFTNIPADYDEFEAVYTKFLGKTPHGAAAMMPMRKLTPWIPAIAVLSNECQFSNVHTQHQIRTVETCSVQRPLPATLSACSCAKRYLSRQRLYPTETLHRGDESQCQQASRTTNHRCWPCGLSLCHG